MTRRPTFFFDGGCRPNPGPIEIAVVHHGRTWLRDDIGSGDNSEAEWRALLFAVRIALDERAIAPLFIGDSTLVVRQAGGLAPCRSPHLLPYLADFAKMSVGLPGLGLRQVARGKNLAGIALDQRRR